MDEIRATLAQLMGSYEGADEKELKKPFTDPDVCKMFLVGLCPHELFENTKQYLGECRNIHSEKLRERYMEERKNHYYGYEEDTLRAIQPIIDDCDRKVVRAKARVEEDVVERKTTLDPMVVEEAKRIDGEIKKKMLVADELGMKGEVEASFGIVEEIEALKKAKLEMLEKAGEVSYQQRLKPCDVCGALLSVSDTDRRLTEHYSGKIHVGIQRLRDLAKTLNAYINEHRNSRNSSIRSERSETIKSESRVSRYKGKSDRRSSSRSPSRRHEYSRSRNSRRRSRSR